MSTELVTAIATAVTAIAGIITIGVTIYKMKENKKKNKHDVFQKLSRYDKWLDNVSKFLKQVFHRSNNELTVKKVIDNNFMYKPVEELGVPNLEEITEKIGYVLSGKEEEIENYCQNLTIFIKGYEYLEKEMLKKVKGNILFKEMRNQLKNNCPNELIKLAGMTEGFEFSDCIEACIEKLKKQWKEIQPILNSNEK